MPLWTVWIVNLGGSVTPRLEASSTKNWLFERSLEATLEVRLRLNVRLTRCSLMETRVSAEIELALNTSLVPCAWTVPPASGTVVDRRTGGGSGRSRSCGRRARGSGGRRRFSGECDTGALAQKEPGLANNASRLRDGWISPAGHKRQRYDKQQGCGQPDSGTLPWGYLTIIVTQHLPPFLAFRQPSWVDTVLPCRTPLDGHGSPQQPAHPSR